LIKLDRQIAISDIHGCARTFEKLLFEVVELKRTDTLYLLGDYINKGPDSKGVIDQIFLLEKEGYEVYCLRGNHEQYLLDALYESEKENEFLSRGGIETLQSFRAGYVSDLPAKYIEFFENLGYFFELEDYMLVHAGFDFSKKDIYMDKSAMLNIRAMQVDTSKIDGRKIIHGHVPTPLSVIEQSLDFKYHHISIDSGCVYQHIHALYHLVALDIDSRKLYIQKNVD